MASIQSTNNHRLLLDRDEALRALKLGKDADDISILDAVRALHPTLQASLIDYELEDPDDEDSESVDPENILPISLMGPRPGQLTPISLIRPVLQKVFGKIT